ncbi:DUF3152 domain-containing protein [Phytohabitans rumicis]|uniref:DUF3152 domain-containing protein n=1 Tax=Phytohabitans rumicis TaxID=1076125 RepID=UPI001FEB246C|nr:DUF3152 domain-containing protein [Phytohabitans rumicis]
MALASVSLAGVLALAGVLVASPDAPAADGPVWDAGAPTTPAPSGSATPTPAPSASPTPVLRLPGPVPSTGSGTFEYATGRGPVLGRAGQLRRYRVAVEDGADEDVARFATAVDSALGAPGSWIANGQRRFQRVPDGGGHDFTVYLVTAATAREMCAAVWVDNRVDGKSYTSCRGLGKVIINLDRWRLSVPHYVAAKVPLDVYRSYVVNHEVGHELGFAHERCPGRGKLAPVMMQQTLFLNGCVANPWPYVDGERYAGPPL